MENNAFGKNVSTFLANVFVSIPKLWKGTN